MLDLVKVGRRLEYYRNELGLTQAKLAELSEVSDRTYQSAARGVSMMQLDNLISVCRVLKVTPNDILLEQPDPVTSIQQELAERIAKMDAKTQLKTLKLLLFYADMEMEDKENQ